MRRDVISVEELFLLCSLRGIVEAKNLAAYTWTILHSSHTVNSANLVISATSNSGENHDDYFETAMQEANEKHPIYIPEMREFSLIGSKDRDFMRTAKVLNLVKSLQAGIVPALQEETFYLFEKESQMVWFNPKGSVHNCDWNVSSEFKLKHKLTNKEHYILNSYGLQ